MRLGSVCACVLVLCTLQSANAGPTEDALAKLAPEERSHQACVVRGLVMVRSDARLRTADRMQTSILSPATLKGTTLTAKGGAVRTGGKWYALSFTCQLTADFMKATTFAYAVGGEIPKSQWDTLGLW